MAVLSEVEILLRYALIAAAIAFLFGRDRARAARTNADNRYFFASGFAAVLVQLIMVAKHPEPHYLMPAIGVAAMLTPLALGELASRIRIAFVGSVLAVIGCVFLLDLTTFWQTLRNIGQPVPSVIAAVDKVAADEGCRNITYTRAGMQPALYFGDFWAGWAFAARLRPLYPNFYYYNETARHFRSFADVENPTAEHDLLGDDKSVCLTGTSPLNQPPDYAGRYRIELTGMSGETSLYRIVPVPAADTP